VPQELLRSCFAEGVESESNLNPFYTTTRIVEAFTPKCGERTAIKIIFKADLQETAAFPLSGR